MLDMRFIRENPDKVKTAIKNKFCDVDIDKLLALDMERRENLQRADELKAVRNRVSQEIGELKKKGESSEKAIIEMREVSAKIKEIDDTIRKIEEDIYNIQIWIPNIPHESVPVGTEENNQIVSEWGKIEEPDFTVVPHYDIGNSLGMLDLDRGARLSGSNFVSFKGIGAKLERSLINFMLDLHIEKHGFTEVSVPFIVRRDIMFGTGQIPKLEEDMYCIEKDDMFLIPTAEVPVTNLHRGEILQEEALPKKYVAYTPCFRREAGSYGAETRGLMRIHQFDKVEMVMLSEREKSYDALETLRGYAEEVLQLLELPYRVVTLATGDLSFAAAKCYDLEVYAYGIKKWLEVSSISNFEDFQARRMNLRYRPDQNKKPEFVHTLNGSGLALPRVVIAIMENYQTDEGTIIVPEVLRKYMGTDIIK